MSKLDTLLQNTQMPWTEDEIFNWVQRQPTAKRQFLVEGAREIVRSNPQNGKLLAYKQLCDFRINDEAHAEANRQTWYEIWSDLSTGWLLGGIKTGQVKLGG